MMQDHSHKDFLEETKPEEPTYLKGSFSELNWVNSMSQLPTEENPGNKRHQVKGYNYSKVTPTPRDNPTTVSLSGPALALLDLDKDRVEKDPDTPLYLAGNKVPTGAQPVANCYCGHQFGTFAGQLGDGRAISYGDIRNHKGELWELQLKGSGTTPYSRFADGKAVLRSSIREYLCSEAMWALGIPTTRAASLIVTDSLAERDPLYNGRKIMEKCAIVMRLAPTFLRFGSFEIFKPTDDLSGEGGPSHGREQEMMPGMLDYLLNNHFSEIAKLQSDENLSKDDCYFEMYKEIVKRTAKTFALWQCYGFCHGVLNTDNMSVLGLTIDYGPYGWMDYFDKGFICNHSDQTGRYSYENQPSIGKWNLLKLAEALKSHLPEDKMKAYTNKEYDGFLKKHYYDKMREKLGLYCVEDSEKDLALIDDLFDVMNENASDFNNTFRKLSSIPIPQSRSESNINEKMILEFVDLSPSRDTILERYRPMYSENQIQQIRAVAQSNPMVLMMMNISIEVIDQQEAKLKKFKEMESVDEEQLKKDIYKNWEKWLKSYESRLFSENGAVNSEDTMESENSKILIKTKFDSFQELQDFRVKRMNATNPVYILRNYMAEEVIKKAEKGDFSGVNNLLEILYNPFEVNEKTYEGKEYTKLPPKWAAEICVSCSS